MTDQDCKQLQQWLMSSDMTLPVPDQALTRHVAQCQHCQARLALIFADRLGPPQEPQSCEQLSDDLPAYVEYEQAHGGLSAARAFPQLWWHLWTCQDCCASVHAVALLLQAEASGSLPAPPRLPAPAKQSRLLGIRLDRPFLHAVFAPQVSLGLAWSEQSDPLLLSEHTILDCHVTIHVVQRESQEWELTISVEPPIVGDVLVELGDCSYRAPLINGHVASIAGIPSRMLIDDRGPDLLISLAPASVSNAS